MMVTKAMEIFRAGSHVSSAGQSITFSEQTIRESAEGYNRRVGQDAPLVMGHPADDSQAQRGGVVRGLVAAGKSLYAVADVTHDFVELVRAGRILAVSASFFAPQHRANPMPGLFFLRHVGMLGAHPPALKGLEQLSFSDGSLDYSEAHGSSQCTAPGFPGVLAAAQTIPGLSFMECVDIATRFS